MSKRRASIRSAINATAGTAPEWIEILPAGPEIKGRDGRAWRMGDAQRVVDASAANGAIHIDYEHASETRAPKGGEAPAAGWIEAMEVRAGAVWARVAWTPRAASMVANREYRFVSPVFYFDTETSEVASIVSVALTNRPNLDMTALNRADDDAQPQPKERRIMTPEQHKALCRKLGLADEASADAIMGAVAALQDDKAKAVNAAAMPPLDKFVPRADHDKVVAERDTALNTIATDKKARDDAEITAAVDAAVAAGKIAPATKDYHLASCRAEGGLDRFKAFVAATPAITAPSGLDKKSPGATGEAGDLTADEKALCTRMGLTEDAFKKARAA